MPNTTLLTGGPPEWVQPGDLSYGSTFTGTLRARDRSTVPHTLSTAPRLISLCGLWEGALATLHSLAIGFGELYSPDRNLAFGVLYPTTEAIPNRGLYFT